MMKAPFLFLFCVTFVTTLCAGNVQYIRSFDLGGGGLKTALFSYDESLNTMTMVEPQLQLGVCPPEKEVNAWVRESINLRLQKSLDDEIQAGYSFGFSLAGCDKLRSNPLHTADMALLFQLPPEKVRSIDDGAAHLVASLHMLKNASQSPVWNFAIGTGVGFGFTDISGRVLRLSELFQFFDSAPWRVKEPITGQNVCHACGTQLGFEVLVAQNGGVADDQVFAEFASRWKAFLDSCIQRCTQKQVEPPRAIVFTGGHIDHHGERLVQTLVRSGCALPIYSGVKWSGLTGAAWNAVTNDHKNGTLVRALKNNEDPQVIQQLIRESSDVNGRDGSGDSPLLAAVRASNLQAVRQLIAQGSEVDDSDFLGRTPLFLAVELGNFEMVQLLLGFGAEYDKWDNWCRSMLSVAEQNGNQRIVDMLLSSHVGIR